jgi:hypothetical protein
MSLWFLCSVPAGTALALVGAVHAAAALGKCVRAAHVLKVRRVEQVLLGNYGSWDILSPVGDGRNARNKLRW